MNRPPILAFITNFKRGFNAQILTEVFTLGNCYHFSVILKDVYPEGRIAYSQILGHFFLEIDGRYYDITGEIKKPIADVTYFDTLYYTDSALYRTLLRDCVLKLDWHPGIENKYYVE